MSKRVVKSHNVVIVDYFHTFSEVFLVLLCFAVFLSEPDNVKLNLQSRQVYTRLYTEICRPMIKRHDHTYKVVTATKLFGIEELEILLLLNTC